MTLDSIKKMRGLYTFLKKKMSMSNVLGVCLTVLFVGLCEVVSGQLLIPSYVRSTDYENAKINLQTTGNSGCLSIPKPDTDLWKFQNGNGNNGNRVYTSGGTEIVSLRNQYNPYSGNPQGTGYF